MDAKVLIHDLVAEVRELRHNRDELVKASNLELERRRSAEAESKVWKGLYKQLLTERIVNDKPE